MEYNGLSIKEKDVYGAQEITLNYNRDELKDSKKVFVHYGTNDWKNVNEVEMQKTPNGYEAKISIPGDASKFNFAFRDENLYWDNNEGNNFEFDVQSEIQYFANDFLLKYTEDISFDNTDTEENKEVEVDTHAKGLSDEELDSISFNHTKDEIDKSIEAKFAKLFGSLEKENSVKEEIVETPEEDEYVLVPLKFTSNIPYVSLFKQAKAEALMEIKQSKLEPIKYTSNVSLIEVMRLEANRKWVLAQAARNENAEFALVKAFNPIEAYDNSFVGTIKKYFTSIVESFKKLIDIISEDLNPSNASE